MKKRKKPNQGVVRTRGEEIPGKIKDWKSAGETTGYRRAPE